MEDSHLLFIGGSIVGASLLWMALYAQDFLVDKLGFKIYQFKRVYSWLDPYSYPSDEGYNFLTSMTAIGSGGTSGKGFGGRQVYIPENHTDFIFSVIGEEYGFIGSSIVISLFFVLIYHLTKICPRTERFLQHLCMYRCYRNDYFSRF